MSINPEIFREYDIRGIVDKDLSKEVAKLVGKAFGTKLARDEKKMATVGRDCRLSSEILRDGVIEGILSTGIDVVDLGVVPTPVFYFSLMYLNPDGGIQITGSHNPPEYNGFKVAIGNTTIYGEKIQEIRKDIEKGDFEKGNGNLKNYDIVTPYIEKIANDINISRKLRISIDAGNGTGGEIALKIIKNFPIEIFPLYCEMDGHFPNHHPDPTVVKNMKDLIDIVLKEKLELGIAYDGDADRIGVVDEKGNIIWGDKLMIIFARDILSRNKNGTFISEVKASQLLYDDIKKHGGKAIMWKTGHSLIKEKMREEKALLAGEMSGHIFFADRYYGYDDAIYASMRLLEILSKRKKPLSEFLSDLPKTFATPEIRVECAEEIKFKLVDEVKNFFKDKYQIIDVDGVRVIFDDGWGLVRASNTQPALVLRFEAKSEKRLNEIKEVIEKILGEKKKEFKG